MNNLSLSVFMPVIISFLISVVFCPILIPFLRKLKFGQTEREEGPQSHLKKNGTPTMGGLVILAKMINSHVGITNPSPLTNGILMDVSKPAILK